ncbi:PH domain-containing protein [Zavarzinia compransoris]|uniref:PH domain-containing protein n=1 Tax=Zavarzinia marina TaxID=2911065 RepID=UPI001F258278|nr:PH domain-containing protein [Zavarzinia marina]MCF4166265.1 PH domain-containing protein [Zavarzinia marina]
MQFDFLPGERLLWQGRPRRGLVLGARDFFLIPFSLVWCGTVVAGAIDVLGRDGAFMPKAIMALMLAVGLFILVGRFMVDAFVRGRTHYAVTNQRIVIFRHGPFGSIVSLNLDRLPALELKERPDRRGTLRFSATDSRRLNNGIWMPALDPSPQFLDIEDARNVYTIIDSQRSAAR